jgi:hypothetical protein
MGLIEHFCFQDDLSTYDPYDIWKTSAGFRVKQWYNAHPRSGVAPAAVFTLFDTLVNNRSRAFYDRMDYAVVRATAALCLLNLFEVQPNERHITYARLHLDWLLLNSCKGYKGLGWGLGFPHAVSREIVYSSNTPFTTITPYALEALIKYSRVTGETRYDEAILRVKRFFNQDVVVMEDDGTAMVTSYGPQHDRKVINAVSYTMYAHSLLEGSKGLKRIGKLYEYIRRHQNEDGSWLYSPDGSSFIDCFHSCIVLKNLIKTSQLVPLDGVTSVVRSGYEYVRRTLFDAEHSLFRRFSVTNKYGIVRFDLYDNAEALNLALLMDDQEHAKELLASIDRHFRNGMDIYSQIDLFGFRRNKNTLRWAVMPFLYAASQMVSA